MSLLSSTNYTVILNLLTTMRNSFEEDSWKNQKELEMLKLKINYLGKMLEDQQSLFHNKQESIRNRLTELKNHSLNIIQTIKKTNVVSNFRKFNQKKLKYPTKESQEKSKLLQPIKSIQNNMDELNKTKESYSKNIIKCYEKYYRNFQNRISQLQNILQYKSKQRKLTFAELEQNLRLEVQQCEQLLKKYDQTDKGGLLMLQLQDFTTETQQKIKSLSQSRKKRKSQFLNLLEQILQKVKNEQTN